MRSKSSNPVLSIPNPNPCLSLLLASTGRGDHDPVQSGVAGFHQFIRVAGLDPDIEVAYLKVVP